MLEFLLSFLYQALYHRVRNHHEGNGDWHHCKDTSCSIYICSQIKWKGQGMFRKVESEVRVIKDVSHNWLQSVTRVSYRRGLAADINVDSDWVISVFRVYLLEEKVPILCPNQSSFVVNSVINFLHLIKEMRTGININWPILRKHLPWPNIWSKVLLHKLRHFSICLVEVVQVTEQGTALGELVGWKFTSRVFVWD